MENSALGSALQTANSRLKQWHSTDNSQCLICKGLNKNATHLIMCPNWDRTQLLEEYVSQDKDWMETHYTKPDLARLMVGYLRGKSRQKAKVLKSRGGLLFAKKFVSKLLKMLHT